MTFDTLRVRRHPGFRQNAISISINKIENTIGVACQGGVNRLYQKSITQTRENLGAPERNFRGRRVLQPSSRRSKPPGNPPLSEATGEAERTVRVRTGGGDSSPCKGSTGWSHGEQRGQTGTVLVLDEMRGAQVR